MLPFVSYIYFQKIMKFFKILNSNEILLQLINNIKFIK